MSETVDISVHSPYEQVQCDVTFKVKYFHLQKRKKYTFTIKYSD